MGKRAENDKKKNEMNERTNELEHIQQKFIFFHGNE